jgi:hypothetical protein
MADTPESPYALGEAGAAWWEWAWETPQAAKWDHGALYTVARRALLEDEHAAVGSFDPFALNEFFASLDLGEEESVQDALRELGRIIGRLQALATGRIAISKEMRELEGQLGFGAKSMAALGWKPEEKPVGSKLDELRARREKAAGGSASKAPMGS